ncbi:MAG: FAD-binding oxidoreductase [Chitinophagales bacterium]|nr:FAD-binding oxidoreductase [Chitinophagales bacterium]
MNAQFLDLTKNLKTEPISDKSYFYYSDKEYYEVYSNQVDEIIELVRYASANNLKIKIRGNGHSSNNSTFPSKKEILFRTDSLNKIAIINDSTAFIQSGVILHEAQEYLYNLGYKMIVVNEGGNGPTLGGFISASGIGANGDVGFWETIRSINLIDGNCKNINISNTDSTFKWIFGSMGEFGIIVGAEVKIEKISNEISFKSSKLENKILEKYYYYWFPFMFDVERIDSINAYFNEIKDSILIECGFQNSIIKLNTGGNYVKFQSFNPPLIYENRPFIILGFKCLINKNEENIQEKVENLKSKIIQIKLDNNLQLYFQVATFRKNKENILKFLNSKIYENYKEIKGVFDPNNVFGSDIF